MKGGGPQGRGFASPRGGGAAAGGLPCNGKAVKGFLPRDKKLKPRSCELRTNATPQEQHLWYDFLRHCKPRFTRQRIIGEYIVDFYCHEAALVIELDGNQHNKPEAMEYDAIRTAYLNALGLQVLRFANSEVEENFTAVCAIIQKRL